MKKIDSFKILLIILAASFLYIYYQSTQNGRYEATRGAKVIDTRTGKVYRMESISS